MSYTKENIMDYVNEEDVKFIRLLFLDAYGKQKNIAIMPNELETTFENGCTIYASSILDSLTGKVVLWPDPNTISVLPWRPSTGKVVKMFCDVKNQDGSDFDLSARGILKKAIDFADKKGSSIFLRTEFEFYLFKLDADGNVTNIPYDNASYMDVAPLDKGANIRREICLTLSEMHIPTCGSFHAFGPGQNKILMQKDSPLVAAEDSLTFTSAVKTIAEKNGLYADFSHMPINGKAVSKHRIVLSADPETFKLAKENIKKHYDEIYLFLNNTNNLYNDYDSSKDITFDPYLNEIYIERLSDGYNPYLVYALLIYAIFDNSNTDSKADTLVKAKEIVKNSKFVKKYLTDAFIKEYTE